MPIHECPDCECETPEEEEAREAREGNAGIALGVAIFVFFIGYLLLEACEPYVAVPGWSKGLVLVAGVVLGFVFGFRGRSHDPK